LSNRFSKIDIAGTSITEVQQAYAEANSDQPFAIVGSSGFIEISVKGGSAAEKLKSGRGTSVRFKFV
jgi:S-adenosylmethionine hydrolase